MLKSMLGFYRKKSGMTGKELAKRCGVCVSTIYYLEHMDVISAARLSELQAIAKGLGVPMAKLFPDAYTPDLRKESKQ